MGVPHVTDVLGGFSAWVGAGLPVARGGTLAGRFTPGSLAAERSAALTA
jgi:hypothetical protein